MKTSIAVEILLLVLLYGGVMALAQSVPQTGAAAGTNANVGANLDLGCGTANQQENESGTPAFTNQGYFGSRACEPDFLYTDLRLLEAAASGVSSGEVMQTQIYGDVDVRRVWREALFDAAYFGGANFYSGGSSTNSTFQGFAVDQSFRKRRNMFSFTDIFVYLPSLGFGTVGFAPIPSTSASDPTSAPPSIPVQAIVILNSSSIENTVDGTWQYTPNARSTFSTSGQYELTRYPDDDFQDSNAYYFSSEYDHTLGRPSNRVGLQYLGNLIRFNQVGFGLDTHSFLLEFKRDNHRRFALKVAVGPEYVISTGLTNNFGLVIPTVEAGLSRLWRHSEASIAYVKRVEPGSGILAGSKSDLIEITGRRRFGRYWEATAWAAYVRNSSLPHSPPISYSSEIADLMVSHRISRLLELFLQYDVQYQNTVAGSNVNQLRQSAGIGLTVTPRTVALH